MRWVEVDAAVVTIGHGGPVSGSTFQGLELTGWDDETWILHPMFEQIDARDHRTSDEVHHAEARASLPDNDVGRVLRDIIDRPGTVLIGARSGTMADDPGSEWRRVRWRELVQPGGGALEDREWPPSTDWFPFRSWPVSMLSPTEGSMDASTFRALLAILAHYDADASDGTYFLFAGAHCPGSEARVACGQLSEAMRVVEDHARGGRSAVAPSNIWSSRGTWFTYTDIDLMATKVCGPRGLIDALRADAYLESLDWHRPDR